MRIHNQILLKRNSLNIRKIFSAVIIFLSLLVAFNASSKEPFPLNIAVEFTDHAASAYVAIEKKFFADESLDAKTYETYITGMALSAALTRGNIDAAYMCLIPAINAFANGGVPLKVVAGTHLYGYGLVVNPEKIKKIKDLENNNIRIGCMQEGSAVDALLHKTIEKYNLNRTKVISQTRRMSPPKALIAIKMNLIDAVFIPEHWATIARNSGFFMLLGAKEIWPDMIGSVLIVKKSLIEQKPEIVGKLVKTTKKATDWINRYPEETAYITARHLSFKNEKTIPNEITSSKKEYEITPETITLSMEKLEYTTSINIKTVQETIDYMAHKGYIKKSFKAEEILDLRFLKQE